MEPNKVLAQYLDEGKHYLEKEDPQQALRSFGIAVELGIRDVEKRQSNGPDPGHVEALVLSSKANGMLGNLDEGHSQATKAIKLDGSNAAAYRARAFVSAADSSWSEAIADFKQSLILDPNNAEAQELLAKCERYESEENDYQEGFVVEANQGIPTVSKQSEQSEDIFDSFGDDGFGDDTGFGDTSEHKHVAAATAPKNSREEGMAQSKHGSDSHQTATAKSTSKPSDTLASNEIQLKNALEVEAAEWLEQLSGQKRQSAPLSKWLCDGQILCSALMRLNPGSINASEIRTENSHPARIHNARVCVRAAKEFGAIKYLFQPSDLATGSGLRKTVICVHALGQIARRKQINVPRMTSSWTGVVAPIPGEDDFAGFNDEPLSRTPTIKPITTEDAYQVEKSALKQGVLAHEVDIGMSCTIMDCNCPGFELHVWKKQCKFCGHAREQHKRGREIDKEQDVRPLEFVEEDEEDLGVDTKGYVYEYDENGDRIPGLRNQHAKGSFIEIQTHDLYEGVMDLNETSQNATNQTGTSQGRGSSAAVPGQNRIPLFAREFRVFFPGRKNGKLAWGIYKAAQKSPGIGKIDVYERNDRQGQGIPLAIIHVRNLTSIEMGQSSINLPAVILRDSQRGTFVLSMPVAGDASEIREWYTAVHGEWLALAQQNGHFVNAVDQVSAAPKGRRGTATSKLLNLKRQKAGSVKPQEPKQEVIFFDSTSVATPREPQPVPVPEVVPQVQQQSNQIKPAPQRIDLPQGLYENNPDAVAQAQQEAAAVPPRPSSLSLPKRNVPTPQPQPLPPRGAQQGVTTGVRRGSVGASQHHSSEQQGSQRRQTTSTRESASNSLRQRPAYSQPQLAKTGKLPPGGAGILWNHRQPIQQHPMERIVFRVDRPQAETVLMHHKHTIGAGASGTFLIRASTKKPGDLVLSIYARGYVEHFNFTRNQQGQYENTRGKVLGGLYDLLEYYKENQDGLPHKAVQIVVAT